MDNNKLIVQTNYGPVMGMKSLSVMNEEILSFHKIPYAKAPVSELRFKDPQLPEKWTEVLDGTTVGPWCWGNNKLFEGVICSEDSLFMNVYTKNVKPSKLVPVMVYIHGGGFLNGSGSPNIYSPDYLLQKDVVLITFNYRLGAFGFLNFDDPSLKVPGNAGLKDQCMALKWVRDNAKFFGGDGNNVTLFGESAGGASVHYHMISDMSKGLFDKAILQSGTSLNFWAITQPRNWAERLALAVGWDGKDGAEAALKVLRNTSAEKINEEQDKLVLDEEKFKGIVAAFGPSIEQYVSEQCFLPAKPLELSRNAWSQNIPIIIGGTSDEGLMSAYEALHQNPKILDYLGNCECLVPYEISSTVNDEKCKELGLIIKKQYFGEGKPTLEQYIELMTDTVFWHGIHRTVLSRLSHSKSADTYLYRFNVDSPTFNHFRIMICGKDVRGTCHADDISYLFKNDNSEQLKTDSMEYIAIQRMVGMWTQFALTGNPNDSIIQPTVWYPLKSENVPFKCLNITNELKIIDLPETNRMKTLDSLYDKNMLV